MNNIGICELNSSHQDVIVAFSPASGTFVSDFLFVNTCPTPSGRLNFIDNFFKYDITEELYTTIDTLSFRGQQPDSCRRD